MESTTVASTEVTGESDNSNTEPTTKDTNNQSLVDESVNQTLNVTTLTAEEEDDEKNAFFEYDPSNYTMLCLYRPINDVVGSLIARSSSEGAGRLDIGKKLGMNPKTKGGNRRISNYIQTVVKSYPKEIGQYQKMEGKYRFIKYFLNSNKMKNDELIGQIEGLIEAKFPYKFGDVLKFPNTKLSTLRISDVTMKRMYHILRILRENRIILTSLKLVRAIQEKDAEEGYPFKIDKKSANKCLLALQRINLCNVFQTEYVDGDARRPFEIYTISTITSVDDPEVKAAIVATAAEYDEQQKIFPTGTIKPMRKDAPSATQNDDDVGSDNFNRVLKRLNENMLNVNADRTESDNSGFNGAEFINDILRKKSQLSMAPEKTVASLACSLYKRRTRPKKRKATEESTLATTAATSAENGQPEIVKGTLPNRPKTLMEIKREILGENSGQHAASANAGTRKNGTADNSPTPKSAKRKRRKPTTDEGSESFDTDPATSGSDLAISMPPPSGTTLISKLPPKKKRPLDEVDRLSQSRMIYMRNRFSACEKDMLVMIRAVSYFLNPVHRFWLDPSVMRDIMHKYVAESRIKTANSLLAAGVRDLGNPKRMAHLQYIVRTLSAYKEMRDFRNQVPTLKEESKKQAFFKEAFEKAYELLFKDCQSFPSFNASDEEFDKFLASNNYEIASNIYVDEITEPTLSTNEFPLRSSKPFNEDCIRHCVNFNIIVSVLLNDPDAMELKLLRGIGAPALSDVLELLHRDGLVSKTRLDRSTSSAEEPTDDQLHGLLRTKANLSAFYRHFFHHSFAKDVMQTTKSAIDAFKADSIDISSANDLGTIFLLSSYFTSDDLQINFTVPSSLGALFTSKDDSLQSTSNATKQLRHLENADLHIDLIEVLPSSSASLFRTTPVPFERAMASLSHKVPLKKLEDSSQRTLDDVLLDFEELDRQDAKMIYNTVLESEENGLSEEELLANTHLEPLRLKVLIEQFIASYNIFPCGIDTRRYVVMKYSRNWMMIHEGFGFFPRPWSLSNGDINCSILRWMAEALLVMIHKKPGILVKQLISTFAFVLQPIVVEEILCLLETIGCCHVHTKALCSMKKTSGIAIFWGEKDTLDGKQLQKQTRYIVSVFNGMQLFNEFFRDYI